MNTTNDARDCLEVDAKIQAHARLADELRALISEARARGLLGAGDFAGDDATAREVERWRRDGRPLARIASLGALLTLAAFDMRGQIASVAAVLSGYIDRSTDRHASPEFEP